MSYSLSCVKINSPVSDDTISPQSFCPIDIVVSVGVEITGSLVYWTEPTTLDHFDSRVSSQTHQSGTFFLVGETTVTYVFTDSFGDSTTCTFIVSVVTGENISLLAMVIAYYL